MPTVSIYIWFIFHLESGTWQTRSCFFQYSIMSMIYFFSNNLWDPRKKKCSALLSYNVKVFALKKKKKMKHVNDLLFLRKYIWFFSHTPKASSFSFLQVNGELCFSLTTFHDIFSFFLCSVINAIPMIVIDTQQRPNELEWPTSWVSLSEGCPVGRCSVSVTLTFI